MKRYEGVWRRYSRWCEGLEEAPLPVSEEKATGYVVSLAQEGIKAATVRYHLAGLRQAHIRAGLPPPDWSGMAKLAQIRRGMERVQATSQSQEPTRQPIRWPHMRALQSVWGTQGVKGRMLWAAACLCFFGCLRAGEALAPEQEEFDAGAHLTWTDVEVGERDGKERVRVCIKQSKTDRLRRGAHVVLDSSGMGICPVQAILAYMIDRKTGPGPFFKDEALGGLTRKRFVKEVKKALELAGLSSAGISGHSFRIGAATAAAAGGASDEEVKALGRWTSREYKGYIRKETTTQHAAVEKLGQGEGQTGT